MTDWYNDECKQSKMMKQKLEDKWRTTPPKECLEVDRQAFMAQDVSHNKVQTSTKQDYYVNKIEQISGNQKALFSITDNLLNMKTRPELYLM